MSTHTSSRRNARKRRNVHALNSLTDQPRPHQRPGPHEVFMLWLMLLPEDSDKTHAAQKEIEKIDATPTSSRDLLELRRLFLELTPNPNLG